jgi:predicted amidohydrolase
MKVCVAQILCTPGDVSSNCSKITDLVHEAKEKDCEVVVFPEMVDTGYDMSMLKEIASTWDIEQDDSPFSILSNAARDNGIYLICGISEKVDEGIYNTTAVFSPSGDLAGKYRKTHLAAYSLFDEDRYIVPGDTFETVLIGDMAWGMVICYDIRFPEISRLHVLGGAIVLQVSSAFPFPRLLHWRTLLRARAIENQAYVIAANRVGTDAGVTFCGSSCIIDPYGVTVAEAAVDREELITGEVSAEMVTSVREQIPFLKQRRDDLY